MNAAAVKPEYPRMQFRRESYVNLNGIWSYEFDFGQSGLDRGLQNASGPFAGRINVPFAPESPLSGVNYRDFIPAMFYQRTLDIPAEWEGKRIILNFGAVDYLSTVYIDGCEAGRHCGSSGAFSVDITKFVRSGAAHSCVVHVVDDTRSGVQGLGKQSARYDSYGCCYTRTTGIWQTVFMEAVDPCALKRCRITPDSDTGSLIFTPEFYELKPGMELEIEVKAGDRRAGGAKIGNPGSGCSSVISLDDIRLWSPQNPFLYDVIFTVRRNGKITDTVCSYAALRKVSCCDGKVFLNGKPLYLKLVLDQGFYPDGTWTSPSDAALKRDIEISMNAGFNGARLHQKVFEDRFHYWADKLGYLTWAEFPNWGMDWELPEARCNFMSEWREIVSQLENHPSIIAWTPLNETCWFAKEGLDRKFRGDGRILDLYRKFVSDVYDLTKSLDPSRPVNDASGFLHVKTDLWTVHPYKKNAEELMEFLFPESGEVCMHSTDYETGYTGQPIVVDEFGGFKFVPPERRTGQEDGWGYNGIAIESGRELRDYIFDQTRAMAADGRIAGWCYTQLTDVEQEQNGVYCYDRTPKATDQELREALSPSPEWPD